MTVHLVSIFNQSQDHPQTFCFTIRPFLQGTSLNFDAFSDDCLNVMKPELMVMGRDGRPVQRARRRFSVRESNKQIRS